MGTPIPIVHLRRLWVRFEYIYLVARDNENKSESFLEYEPPNANSLGLN